MTLTGRVNGREIRFAAGADGRWSAEVPRDESGSYVLELRAEDDAGNRSSRCAAVVCIDFSALSVRVLRMDLEAAREEDGLRPAPLPPAYAAEAWTSDYTARPLAPEFTIREIELL